MNPQNQAPKIIIGEHTITIEQNGRQAPLDPQKFEALKTEAPTLPNTPADDYYAGDAVKALKDEGEIEGYLIVWGNEYQRDKQGEFFTPQTELRLEYYQSRPVLFHHGLGDADSIKIGEIYDLQIDNYGVKAKARLFLNHENEFIRRYANFAWQETQANKMFWSSGSVGHLVDVEPNGQITKWPLVEGSLTPKPAEPYRTKVNAIRSATKHAYQQFIEAQDRPKEAQPKEDTEVEAATKADKKQPKQNTQSNYRKQRGKIKMIDQAMIDALIEKGLSAEQVLAVIGTLGEASSGGEPDAIMADEPMNEEEEEAPFRSEEAPVAQPPAGKSANERMLEKAIQAQKQETENLKKLIMGMKTAPATEQLRGRNGNDKFSGITHRVKSKYDDLTVMDLAFLKSVMDGATVQKREGAKWQAPDSYYRALAVKTEDEKIPVSEEAARIFAAIKSAPIKNDELNYSTQASYGDEFVPELWSNNLWRTPRMENPVFANSTVIEMPSNPYKLPIEGSDPTVYAVGETKNESALTLDSSNSPIPDSKIGTSNTTMTAAKLALRVMLAEELNEDSIIPVISLWREQAVREMEDARDAVILSADASATTSNINYDGTSATTSVAAVSRFLYGGGDGYLHVPLVDDTTQKVDMGGVAPTLTKIREARGKLDRTIFQKRNELVYYCDPETLLKLESLDEAIVTSINGVGSTFEGRDVKAIDGIPVFPTAEMSLATSTGVVSSTGSNNTLGRLLLVHKPSWYVGFRRNMRVTFDYIHHYDAHMLVVTMRMALIKRANDTVSLLYNIAV